MTTPNTNNVFAYYHQIVIKGLENSIKNNRPALLVGQTATGKTTAIREFARQQDKKLTRINLTGQTGVDELLGKWLIKDNSTYWLDGEITRAIRQGDWLVLDEINMAIPEILSSLHSLLDDDHFITLKEKDGEVVKIHPETRIFATMNPTENYAGTKELNKAFLSRFDIVLDVGYSPKETQLLIDRGATPELANDLIQLAQHLRATHEKGGLDYICSTRDLLSAVALHNSGLDITESLEMAIINKANDYEKDTIKQATNLIFNCNFEIIDPETNDKKILKSYKEVKEHLQTLENQLATTRDSYQKYKDETKLDLERKEKYLQALTDIDRNPTDGEFVKKVLADLKARKEKN